METADEAAVIGVVIGSWRREVIVTQSGKLHSACVPRDYRPLFLKFHVHRRPLRVDVSDVSDVFEEKGDVERDRQTERKQDVRLRNNLSLGFRNRRIIHRNGCSLFIF